MLNHEQSKMLKKNLIRDTKDSKNTFVALVSESIPSATKSSVTITELEPSDSDFLSNNDSAVFDESLALLANTFRRFAHKSNFQKPIPLSITDKPKSTPVHKAASFCYNGQGKAHFASECRSKKNKFGASTSASSASSKDAKYLKLKEKYRKIKSQHKGRGLVAEDHDWADSLDESSDEEDETESPYVIALNDETEVSLMANLEEVPEVSTSSASTSSSQVSSTHTPSDSLSARDSPTVDLYNALN